ncbi:MAG: bifunctional phosphopantothenoylcysteine decarboxylase/phosphopantothenate--cysteine ligase CoaBC [Candidatus Beckwithbacteria bacterium]|nr:bifunctional phosphopantothenoylcysteine decarboxylase/phosphopantothenate--cysteine ligase CoaBC [Candidatus Beckwithbacteria bacterium]
MLKKQTIVLGVSGGIAAYKTVDLVKLLKKQGFDVFVVLTQSATNFVKPAQLRRVTGHKVYTDLFEPKFDYRKILTKRKVEHIELADKADLILIVPATANLLAKLAHGIADDFLTTTVLATRAPVMICPAMNSNMWQHPAVKDNLSRLQSLGYQIINPVAGMLACGYEGLGRLEELRKIVAAVADRLELNTSLKNKKILVTAGPTRESIDSVRFITNLSSGKMGAAIAAAATRRGAKVRLLLGPKDFTTGKDLLALVKKYAPRFDLVFHTAAVGDFRPECSRRGKISSHKPQELRLETQVKILAQIKKFNPKITVVGFKAESGLPKKFSIQPGADATVYNDVSRKDIGFGSEDNEVILVLPGYTKKIRKAPKAKVAIALIDELSRYYHW